MCLVAQDMFYHQILKKKQKRKLKGIYFFFCNEVIELLIQMYIANFIHLKHCTGSSPIRGVGRLVFSSDSIDFDLYWIVNHSCDVLKH